MLRVMISVAALSALAACSNPINERTARNYSMLAYNAQQAGDWITARTYWGRAAINAELGGSAPQRLAVLWYEYGRSSGVICDWPEAESGLTKAFELDRASNGPSHMSLVELARMNLDRQRYGAAIGYFERANAIVADGKLETVDPIGYAHLLDEYAVALQNVGRISEAAEFRKQAARLRNAYPASETRTDRTPYGSQCQSS